VLFVNLIVVLVNFDWIITEISDCRAKVTLASLEWIAATNLTKI